MDMQTSKLQGKHARIQMWNAGYRQACAVTTIKSHISNMIIGVTEGFRYKMRLVHAHFPITAVISKDQKQIEIKNFLGGKKSHLIKLNEGCTVYLNKDVKVNGATLVELDQVGFLSAQEIFDFDLLLILGDDSSDGEMCMYKSHLVAEA